MSHITIHVPVVYKNRTFTATVKAVFHKAIFGAPAEIIILGGRLEKKAGRPLTLNQIIDSYSDAVFRKVCAANNEKIVAEAEKLIALC